MMIMKKWSRGEEKFKIYAVLENTHNYSTKDEKRCNSGQSTSIKLFDLSGVRNVSVCPGRVQCPATVHSWLPFIFSTSR